MLTPDWAAEEKIAHLVVLSKIADELKARVFPIEEQHRSGGNRGQEGLSFFPRGAVDTHDPSGHGNMAKHVVGCSDYTPGIVPLALMVQTTSGIELLPDFLGCRKGVLRSIEGNDRHPVEEKRGASAHTFRHTYASHLLQGNYDIRILQALLGHSDIKTTMIYMLSEKSTTIKEAKSPLDL